MSFQETIWSGVLDHRINDIRLLLAKTPRRKSCQNCGDSCESVQDILVDHHDFCFVVPLRICQRCATQSPFPPLRYSWRWIQLELRRAWNLLRSSRQLGSQERPRDDVSAQLAESLFEAVPEYRELKKSFPDLSISFLPEQGFREAESPLDEVERFLRSVHIRISCSNFNGESELAKSGMPSVILAAFIEAIDERLVQFFHDCQTSNGLIAQLGAVLLPDRKWQFDSQVASLSDEVPRDQLMNRLRKSLDGLPSWPVQYPVVFVVRRSFGHPPDSLYSTLSPPFDFWAARLSAKDNLTYAEMALRIYDVKDSMSPVTIDVNDIVALEKLLPHSTSLKLAHADLLQALGKNAEALEIYSKLIELFPDEPGVFHQYLFCLAADGQVERAAFECQQRIARHPDETAAYAHLAKLQAELNQPHEALKQVDKALSLRESADYFQLRAGFLMDLDRFDEALSAVNAAIYLDRNLGRGYFLRGRLHFRAGRFEEALADLIQCDRCMGRSFESLQMQATALIALGRVRQAEQFYRSALSEAPRNVELKLQWIDFLVHTGKLESARQECDAIIAAGDQMGMAHAAKAFIDFEMGQFEDCIRNTDQAIQQGSDGAKVYLVRGIAKAAKGELNEGLEDLDICVEKAPEFAAGRFHRGRIRMALEDFEQAAEEFTAALELIPDWTDALVERGYARLGQEDHLQAKHDFDLAIKLAPERADAYTGRALTSMAEGKKVAASEDLNKALVLDPHNLRGRLNRAKLNMEQSEMELAKDDLNEILAAHPEHAAALWHRAHVRLFLGHFAEAKTDFDRLIELTPLLPHPLIGRSVASELAHDIDKAEADREEARRLAPYSVEQLTQFQTLLTASVANSNEQFELASDLTTRMIDESPVPPWDAYRIRGHARWYAENYVEALEDYTHLIENCDDVTRYDFSAYGQVLGELGEFEKGLEALDRSIEIAKEQDDPVGLAFSYNGRGRVLVGLGRLEEAEESFIESLKIKPDNAWLHYNRGMMFFERKESTKALACFELALCVESPKLPPGKRRRANGFIQKMRISTDP